MFKPDDPLAPPTPVFDEPWQAQALALADTLVTTGRVSANDWAQVLGQELRSAEATGKPDTVETYYHAVIAALEAVSTTLGLTPVQRAERRSAWEDAYRRTPHGAPVVLTKDAG